MTITKTIPFDEAEYLTDPQSVALYFADALESGDAGYIQHALGVLARAKGMSVVAEATGLGRESLYKALKEDGNPRFDTIMRVTKALGLTLSARLDEPAEAA